jgi:L-iditol 2-dehydrogenase
VPLNTNIIHYRQLIVTGTTRASIGHFRKTLNFIAEGLIDLSNLVTGRFALSEIEQAFECAEKAVGLKNIIEF